MAIIAATCCDASHPITVEPGQTSSSVSHHSSSKPLDTNGVISFSFNREDPLAPSSDQHTFLQPTPHGPIEAFIEGFEQALEGNQNVLVASMR